MSKIDEARRIIDRIDEEMAKLFEERMKTSEKIAEYKKENGIPILDANRENELMQKNAGYIKDANIKDYYIDFLKEVMNESKKYQNVIINGKIANRDIDDLDGRIVIRRGSLDKVNEYFNLNRKVLIVTDSGVPSIYVDIIKKASLDAYVYCVKKGEESKNIFEFKNILSFLINHSFTRTDCVVACGGGVVGDLAGFVSSSYMRGIDFYNVPTTLLSQVDASIGGKCAIDFEGVKNIVGSFYQAKCVLIDPNVLDTLEERQFKSGLVEAIKMGVTLNSELFELIKNSKNIKDDIENVIFKCVELKKNIVSLDKSDKGLRRVLNFGHTIGHAIEAKEMGKLYHGECVAIGMMYMVSEEVKSELEEVFNKYEINTNYEIKNYKELIEFIKRDKKMEGNILNIVYVNNIGSYEFKTINIETIKEYLEGRNR